MKEEKRSVSAMEKLILAVLVASITINFVMCRLAFDEKAKHNAQIAQIQQELEAAEKMRDQALEQYGELILEMQRSRFEQEQIEPESAEQEPQEEEQEEEQEYQYVGQCKITYYCCERYPHICGNGDGLTAIGIPAEPGIVAVDPDVIELGSTVIIDGVEYLAADTGGAINGLQVDVCVSDHSSALAAGVKMEDVWIVNKKK